MPDVKKPGKLEPNPNVKGQVVPKSKESKSGKFIGVEAAVHIHTEGSTYHVKFGSATSTRKEFKPNDAAQIQAAYDHMKKTMSGKDGFNACKEWFKKRGAKV